MKSYVLGFAIDRIKNEILLVKKNRPVWQAGLYNGIGGKIEDNESAIEAMMREFKEECGIETHSDNWQYLTRMGGNDWVVLIYYSTNIDFSNYKTCTDELIEKVPLSLDWMRNNAISNLSWLVGLILDRDVAKIDIERINYM